jgi:hypothetical protein
MVPSPVVVSPLGLSMSSLLAGRDRVGGAARAN